MAILLAAMGIATFTFILLPLGWPLIALMALVNLLSCGYYPSMGTYVEIDSWEKTLTEQAHTKKRELEQRVYQLADAIQGKLNRLAALADEHRTLRKGRADRGLLRESRARVQVLKRSLKRDWKSWARLCGVVLDLSAQPA